MFSNEKEDWLLNEGCSGIVVANMMKVHVKTAGDVLIKTSVASFVLLSIVQYMPDLTNIVLSMCELMKKEISCEK